MNIIKQKRGFTLIEFLLSLVFLSIITALLVPLMTTARERATQKSTLLDMQKWAEAMGSYVADYSRAPTSPQGRLDYKKAILDELSPYLSPVSIVDWWGYPYRIWTGKGITRYGITTGNEKEFIIASFGRKGYMERWRYDPKNPEQGLFFVNSLEDYEKDLVIWNNRFIRFPKNFIFTYQSNNRKD
jgi:prepilin-type N-terminal cleavage/methylation domain-containing protein